MQRSNRSRYLSEDEVLGFPASDGSEEKEISDWISTDDGEEDREEIPLFSLSSEEEMDDQLRSSTFAKYFLSKPKRGVATSATSTTNHK